MSKAKKWLYAYPELAHKLLNMLTYVISDYLIMQVQSGAQIIQVFDSSAEYLNKDLYTKFGLPYLKTILKLVRDGVSRLKLEQVPMVSYMVFKNSIIVTIILF